MTRFSTFRGRERLLYPYRWKLVRSFPVRYIDRNAFQGNGDILAQLVSLPDTSLCAVTPTIHRHLAFLLEILLPDDFDK